MNKRDVSRASSPIFLSRTMGWVAMVPIGSTNALWYAASADGRLRQSKPLAVAEGVGLLRGVAVGVGLLRGVAVGVGRRQGVGVGRYWGFGVPLERLVSRACPPPPPIAPTHMMATIPSSPMTNYSTQLSHLNMEKLPCGKEYSLPSHKSAFPGHGPQGSTTTAAPRSANSCPAPRL